MDIDKNVINKIGYQITLRATTAMEKGEITQDQASDIAEFVLANLDTCKTQQELIGFLEKLSQQWPLFVDYLSVEKGKVLKKQEDITVKRVEDLIHNNKLDEALTVAEHASAPTQG